jgi:hypothetical protein
MQHLFDLPSEKEVEENEQHAKLVWEYSSRSGVKL